MQIKTALYNADHLEYGIVTIPFPIPKDQYDSTIKMLEAFDIGDPRERDCTVREVLGPVPSLKCLEGTQINVDELDYLVKRLDSFSDDEIAQFQAILYGSLLSETRWGYHRGWADLRVYLGNRALSFLPSMHAQSV